MPIIHQVKPVKQASENTCWLACIRMLAPLYKLAIDPDDLTAAKVYLFQEISTCKDVKNALDHHKIHNEMEDEGAGPFAAIKEQIDGGIPLIALVNTKDTRKLKNSFGGHYVVVVGYEADVKNGEWVYFFDPADGLLYPSKFSVTLLAAGGTTYFWSMMYYLKAPPATQP